MVICASKTSIDVSQQVPARLRGRDRLVGVRLVGRLDRDNIHVRCGKDLVMRSPKRCNVPPLPEGRFA
jgi:hypothetical protein